MHVGEKLSITQRSLQSILPRCLPNESLVFYHWIFLTCPTWYRNLLVLKKMKVMRYLKGLKS